MNKIYISFLFALSAITSFAQIPDGYYDDADGLSGEQLKTALYHIIKGHNSQSYSSIWTHFETTDDKPNGKVWDMYSDIPGGTPPYEYSFGSDQCGNYSQEGDCYNREHSFPKSWFDDAAPMVTDLFHIVPTDGYVNGQRSNWPYGETSNPDWTSMNGSKRGNNSTSGYSGTIFEPIDEYKGDFARIYFYMATRYENVIPSWENNSTNSDVVLDGTTYPVFEDWCLQLLIDWHNNDPLSQKEIDRNNDIYDIQNNRNPFVDHEEWVSLVWGTNEAPVITNVVYTPSTPSPGQSVNVSAQITDDVSVEFATLYWGLSSSNLNNSDEMNGSGSNYSAVISGQSAGVTVYFKIQAVDGEGLMTETGVYLYTVGSDPNQAPVISNVSYSPSNPSPGESVNVEAEITDDVNVESATLYWGMSASNLNNSVGMSGSGNDYSAIIPGQSAGNTVYFKIQAIDDEGLMAETGIYQYTVESDPNQAPVIANVEYSPSSPSAGEEVTVSAEITDDEGVESAIVLWGYSSSNLANILEMSGTGNQYSASIPGQDEGISVFFKVQAFDEDDLMTESELFQYTVEVSTGTLALPFIENFENEDLGIFNSYSVTGPNETWHNNEYDDNLFAEMTNFNGNDYIENEDWMITPAINFDAYSNEVLRFRSAMNNYSDENTFLKLKVSANYDGVSDPNSASWENISGEANWSSGDFEWIESGDIDLSSISGSEVYLAFQYVSLAGSGKTWQLDNISITLDGSSNLPPVITNVSHTPEEPNSLDEVLISAQITDDDAVQSAQIYYGTSVSQMNEIVSMNSSDNTYSGTIPPQNAFTTIYYRIKAIDSDGEVSYSSIYNYYVDIVDDVENVIEAKMAIYPNPANDYIQVDVRNVLGKIELKIFHSSGLLVWHKEIYSKTIIDISNLAPSYYLVKISGENFSKTVPLIIYSQ